MKLQEILVPDVIEVSPDETIGAAAMARPAFAVGPCLKVQRSILLKNPMNASTTLSMNGKFPMISNAPPFVLRFSKDERKVFQQNQYSKLEVWSGDVEH